MFSNDSAKIAAGVSDKMQADTVKKDVVNTDAEYAMKEGLYERTVSSEAIFEGRILHVYKDSIELPNGKAATREYLKHGGAVCIIPVTDEGNVILERQYRYPLHRAIIEIPAGKCDTPDEDRLMAAKRELKEETGYTADTWTDLGEFEPTCAYSSENISMYLARDLHEGERKLDPDEFLNVFEMPLSDLVEKVMSGKIKDGKTQIAALKAARILGL